MTEITKIDDNGTLSQSSKMLHEMVKRATSAVQFDIILAVIAKVDACADRLVYNITLSDFFKLIDPVNPYKEKNKREVLSAIKELHKCAFWLYSENAVDIYSFVKHSHIDFKTGLVSIKISEDVIPFFLMLKDHPTFYQLKDVLSLHTIFQKSVFLWLMSWSGKSEAFIDIDEAKLLFHGEKDIRTIKLIEKLKDAMRTINRLTPLSVSFDKIKQGRKIVRLVFHIRRKKTPSPLSTEEAESKRRKKIQNDTVKRIEKLTNERNAAWNVAEHFRDECIKKEKENIELKRKIKEV